MKSLTTSYEMHNKFIAWFLAMNDHVPKTCSAPSATNSITKECHCSCNVVSCWQADTWLTIIQENYNITTKIWKEAHFLSHAPHHSIKSRHRAHRWDSWWQKQTHTAYPRGLYAYRNVSSHVAAVIHIQVVNMEVIHMFVSSEIQWKHIL